MNLSALFKVVCVCVCVCVCFFGGVGGLGMSLNKSGALLVEFY